MNEQRCEQRCEQVNSENIKNNGTQSVSNMANILFVTSYEEKMTAEKTIECRYSWPPIYTGRNKYDLLSIAISIFYAVFWII
jgi:hypothetical protein